jgi:hypothetical protein
MKLPRLEFSSVGASGAYPPWVRGLVGYSGCYVIAEDQPGEKYAPVVYVGESHTDRVYATLTRHFQTWHRFKSQAYYRGGGGYWPGLTYDRARCQVAVVLTPSGAPAINLQAILIAALHPRDNQIGQVDDDQDEDAAPGPDDLEPAPF